MVKPESRKDNWQSDKYKVVPRKEAPFAKPGFVRALFVYQKGVGWYDYQTLQTEGYNSYTTAEKILISIVKKTGVEYYEGS
jgi:hypothetical protein